jgi:hypothetical protein
VRDVVESTAPHTFSEVLHSDAKITPIEDQKYRTEINGAGLNINLLSPPHSGFTIEQNVVMGPGRPGSVDKGSPEARGQRLVASTPEKVIKTEFVWNLAF